MTTVLVALIGAALALYALKVVIEASMEFYALFTASFTWELGRKILPQLMSFAFSVALLWILSQAIWRFYYGPRVKRLQNKLEDTQKQIEDSYADLERTSAEVTTVLDESKSRFAEISSDLAKRIDAWEKRTVEYDKKSDDIKREIEEKIAQAKTLIEKIEARARNQ